MEEVEGVGKKREVLKEKDERRGHGGRRKRESEKMERGRGGSLGQRS